MKDMVAPLRKLKAAVLRCALSPKQMSEIGSKGFDFKFHLDPFKEDDDKATNYATFQDYDMLLDPYLPLPDRQYLWYYHCLKRAIDTLAKVEQIQLPRTTSTARSTTSPNQNPQVVEAPWEDRVFDTLDEFIKQRIADWSFNPEETKLQSLRKLEHTDIEGFTSSEEDSDFSESSVSYGDSSSDPGDKKDKKAEPTVRSLKIKHQASKKMPKRVTAFAGALELQAQAMEKLRK